MLINQFSNCICRIESIYFLCRKVFCFSEKINFSSELRQFLTILIFYHLSTSEHLANKTKHIVINGTNVSTEPPCYCLSLDSSSCKKKRSWKCRIIRMKNQFNNWKETMCIVRMRIKVLTNNY